MIRPAVAILIALLLLPLPVGALELRLAYIDQDARPYLTGAGTDIPAQPGIAVELVQRAVSQLGATLVLTRLPARRMAEDVKAGRQDGILGFRHSPERARDLVFPMQDGKPDATRYAARLAHSLYRRHDSGVTWDGQRVGGLTAPVAVSSTQLVADALLAQGIEILRIESSGQMFAMLSIGRVDAVVVIDALGDRQLREQGAGQIEKVAPPMLVEDFHVPVSPRFYAARRDFTERLWRLIGEQRDGVYAELLPKYLF
jgi:polar amino acid transport system substrate-binding protein